MHYSHCWAAIALKAQWTPIITVVIVNEEIIALRSWVVFIQIFGENVAKKEGKWILQILILGQIFCFFVVFYIGFTYVNVMKS